MPGNKELSRKEKIIEAAKRLFRHYGFAKTTTEDISKEAEISKGSIYLEFSSKQDIMLSIVEKFLDEQIQRIEKVHKKEDAQNYINIFQKSLVNYVLETYDLAYPYSHNVESFIHTSSRVRNEMEERLNKIQELFAEMLKKAQTHKEINLHTTTPEEITSLIFTCLDSCFPPYECTKYLKELTRKKMSKQVQLGTNT